MVFSGEIEVEERILAAGGKVNEGAAPAAKSRVATEDSGLDFDMWETMVNRDGVLRAVARNGLAPAPYRLKRLTA